MNFVCLVAFFGVGFAVPIGTSRSVKAVTSAAGPGSIEIKHNADIWNLEWEVLTDEIKTTVTGKLEEAGINARFDDNGNFVYTRSGAPTASKLPTGYTRRSFHTSSSTSWTANLPNKET